MKEFARPLIVAAPREYTDFKYSLKRSLLTHLATAVMGFYYQERLFLTASCPLVQRFVQG